MDLNKLISTYILLRNQGRSEEQIIHDLRHAFGLSEHDIEYIKKIVEKKENQQLIH